MKNKDQDWFIIIIAIVLIVMPFALNYSLDKKILLPSTGIGMLGTLINNKKIRFSILIIALIVILFVVYKWYL